MKCGLIRLRSMQEMLDVHKNENQPAVNPSVSSGGSTSGDHNLQTLPEDIEKDDRFSDSLKARKKYRGVADAAQAAFESAAYAAAAARAAVELSRSEPHDPDNQDSPRDEPGKFSHKQNPTETASESESEEIYIERQVEELKKSVPSSSSDSASYTLDATRQADPFGKDIVFDESESDTDNEQSNRPPPSHMQTPSRFQAGLKIESDRRVPAAAGSGIQDAPRLNIEKGPFSVRTRRLRGY